jgi:hypothetical protein
MVIGAFFPGPFDDIALFLAGLLLGVLALDRIRNRRVIKLAEELMGLLNALHEERSYLETLRKELEP